MNRLGTFCSTMVLVLVVSLIAVIPQQTLAQAEKGAELYGAGKYQEAEKALQEVLKKDPKNIQAGYYLGLSMLMQQKYREALDEFQKVAKSQERSRSAVPSEIQIQLALARARLGLKQYDEAWKNLESAGKEDANASDVYVYRGVYYLNQARYAQAIKELEKAISLDDQNPYAYYYSGMANYKSGNGKKASEDLKTFIKLAPDAPEVEKARETINLC